LADRVAAKADAVDRRAGRHDEGLDSLVLAGIIRVTAVDAYQRDWPVVLAADCVDSYDREHHEISLRYMQGKIAAVMTNQEIRKELAETRR
jgi:isochorismate hydrolase